MKTKTLSKFGRREVPRNSAEILQDFSNACVKLGANDCRIHSLERDNQKIRAEQVRLDLELTQARLIEDAQAQILKTKAPINAVQQDQA